MKPCIYHILFIILSVIQVIHCERYWQTNYEGLVIYDLTKHELEIIAKQLDEIYDGADSIRIESMWYKIVTRYKNNGLDETPKNKLLSNLLRFILEPKNELIEIHYKALESKFANIPCKVVESAIVPAFHSYFQYVFHKNSTLISIYKKRMERLLQRTCDVIKCPTVRNSRGIFGIAEGENRVRSLLEYIMKGTGTNHPDFHMVELQSKYNSVYNLILYEVFSTSHIDFDTFEKLILFDPVWSEFLSEVTIECQDRCVNGSLIRNVLGDIERDLYSNMICSNSQKNEHNTLSKFSPKLMLTYKTIYLYQKLVPLLGITQFNSSKVQLVVSWASLCEQYFSDYHQDRWAYVSGYCLLDLSYEAKIIYMMLYEFKESPNMTQTCNQYTESVKNLTLSVFNSALRHHGWIDNPNPQSCELFSFEGDCMRIDENELIVLLTEILLEMIKNEEKAKHLLSNTVAESITLIMHQCLLNPKTVNEYKIQGFVFHYIQSYKPFISHAHP